MLCYQCEQTARGEGCTVRGVCGKEPNAAGLQDLIVYACKGIGQYAHRARLLDASDREVDVFVIEALFATVTNVDFDEERLAALVYRAAEIRDKAKGLYEQACAEAGKEPEATAATAASRGRRPRLRRHPSK